MKRKIKENAGCFFVNYFCYTLFMLGWWIVLCFPMAFFVDTLGNLIKKGVWSIFKSIPIEILLSLVLAALYSIGEEKLFPIVKEKKAESLTMDTDKHGVYRRNAVGYYLWNYVFGMLNLITIFVWISRRYHIFRVTTMIILVLACSDLFRKIFTLSRLRKQMRAWINDASRQNKKVCTYLSEIPYIGANDIFEKSNFATVCKGTLQMFWESKELLICPHWLYRDLFPEEEDRISKFILFADSMFIDREEAAIVIDEFFAAGKDAAVYFHESSNDRYEKRYEKITSHPVHKFYEKKSETDKAINYMTTGTEQVKIPYFGNGMFIHAYPTSLAAIMKYDYIDGEILRMNQMEDSTECFYRLLKVVEYAWHYRALAIISHTPDMYNDLLTKDSFQSSLGLWEKYQNKGKYKFTDKETVEAYCLVSELLSSKTCGKEKISYSELCQVITQLRNRYVGHGTMAFSVSRELLDAVKQLAAIVLGIFYKQEDYLLEEPDKSKEQVPLVYYNTENGRSLCLLAGYVGQEHKISEYLDYQFATFRSNDRVEYRLDYRGGICNE